MYNTNHLIYHVEKGKQETLWPQLSSCEVIHNQQVPHVPDSLEHHES